MLLKDKHKIRVGFSIGDLNGIGPEVLLKSLAKKELQETIVPILYAPYSTICFLKSHFDLKTQKSTEDTDISKVYPDWHFTVSHTKN